MKDNEGAEGLGGRTAAHSCTGNSSCFTTHSNTYSVTHTHLSPPHTVTHLGCCVVSFAPKTVQASTVDDVGRPETQATQWAEHKCTGQCLPTDLTKYKDLLRVFI